jgi:Holliday junction DNA helicase RuvA
LTPEQIQNAVDTKDKTIFTSISGIGPKLAERMILELKGKKFSSNAYIAATSKALQDNNIVEEAAGALSNLGINKQEAVNIVKNILQNDPNSTIDQVIRTALQNRNTK